MVLVPKRVHSMPEPVMFVGDQLLIMGQALKGFSFKNSTVSCKEVQHVRLEHKEATVDPGTVSCWFFLKGFYPVCLVEVQSPKTSRWLRSGHRSSLAVLPMISH